MRELVIEVDDEIIHQGPRYVIARSYRLSGLVPYPPDQRPDGSINDGWIDLRRHPERVPEIPEAQCSLGLTEILCVLAAQQSPLMSGACEWWALDRTVLGGGVYVGSDRLRYSDVPRSGEERRCRQARWHCRRDRQ
jgi:hypothetical protein